MSEVKKAKKGPATTEAQSSGQVLAFNAHKCAYEECRKKPERANFCQEHYFWFKEGLITLEGFKAKDFEKKYHIFIQKKAAA